MIPTVQLDWSAQPVTFSVLVCVLMTLPHVAMVRSVICGISWFQNFCENFIQVTLLLSLKASDGSRVKESHDYNSISNVDILETQLQLFNVPQHFPFRFKKNLVKGPSK